MRLIKMVLIVPIVFWKEILVVLWVVGMLYAVSELAEPSPSPLNRGAWVKP